MLINFVNFIMQVVQDIFQSLHMKEPLKFCAPVFRKNLFYDVWFVDPLTKPLDHLKNFIIEALASSEDVDLPGVKKNCGIIYCRKKESTEILAEKLSEAGIPTLAYHGGKILFCCTTGRTGDRKSLQAQVVHLI